MGSVPNCQKEIPVRHAIRWFKCKLKAPKKHQQYLKKLEQVDCLLKENSVTHVDVLQSTSDEEDIEINPSQGSGKLKNISELSCSEDCLCD